MRLKKEYIDLETGELITKEEILDEVAEKKSEATKKKTEYLDKKKKRDDFMQYVDLNLGSFFFSNYEKLFNEIGKDPALAFRFAYLCTYADFGGILMYGGKRNNREHIPMTEKDLIDVFGLNRTTAMEVKKALYSHNLLKKQDGKLIINEKYIIRGKTNLKFDSSYTRIFANGLREIYNSIKPSVHKKVGLLLVLLPYVNRRYNMLCENPKEENIHNVIPLSMKDICNICDYSIENERKLRKDLLNIKIEEKHAMMYTGNNVEKIYYINPKLYYSGNDLERLRVLGEMFEAFKK